MIHIPAVLAVLALFVAFVAGVGTVFVLACCMISSELSQQEDMYEELPHP